MIKVMTVRISTCCQCLQSEPKRWANGYKCHAAEGRQVREDIANHSFPGWCPLPSVEEVTALKEGEASVLATTI